MSGARPASVAWLAGVCSVLTALLIVAGCSGSGGSETDRPLTTETAETETAQASTPGVSDDRVLFGQSAAFSGPTQKLGKSIRLGIEAAFHEVNQAGGVHGRMLELTSLDDAYEPEAAIVNTRRLIGQGVFALIGAIGTTTSRAVTPIAAEAGVPYIAPFTGAAFLRDPDMENVINLRASYAQEAEEMVERLTVDLAIERIGILYQDDSYGRSGFDRVQDALARRGSTVVAVGRYIRNTSAVKTALLDLQEGNPEAVIMIGAYEPMAALIIWARLIGMDWLFLTVSPGGSNALVEALGSDAVGLLVTQGVPFSEDDSLAVVAAYQRALAAYAPDASPGFVSLEGYLAGRLAIAGLQRCGREVSRSRFLANLRGSQAIDIEGFSLQYGEDDNQGSDKVFLTVLGRNGKYHPIETLREIDTLLESGR